MTVSSVLNSVFLWLLSTLLGLIILYLCKIWYSYNFFKKFGLKTPPYKFFFGNFPEIRKNKNVSEVIRDWTKKYGKTYGYYEGHLPVLVTSDLSMVQEILIKQYGNFSARKKGALDRGEHDHRVNVFTATKTLWKTMRSIINPTFSSAKIRELNGLLLKTSNRLCELLNKSSETEMNVSDYFKRFTMDTIWNCAFGLDIDHQNNPNNDYLEKSEYVFRNAAEFKFYMYLGVYFCEFKRQLTQLITLSIGLSNKLFSTMPSKTFPFMWLNEKVKEIVEQRKQQQNPRKDYVQLLLDAESEEGIELDEVAKVDPTQIRIHKKLTPDEIQRNLVLFMLAGYETTSTALAFIFHTLATKPDEQEKLRLEIDEKFPHSIENPDEVINTDSVQTLEYLDMFVKEVLRISSIASAVMTRRCMYPTKVNGMKMPKDLAIVIDVLSIHFDPDLWGPVDPNVFYPPRFSPEIKRNPLAFLAFGQGPRNCVGMKFAMIEIKMAIIKILRSFEIHSSEKTSKCLEIIEGVVRTPKNPVFVKLKKRE